MTKKIALFSLLFSFIIIQKVFGKDLPIIYFIPGQGADERLFSKLEIDTSYELRHIEYVRPAANMSMKEYAVLLSNQIDTSQPFILIGASLGGMLATEMSTFLQPEQVIIIASAKSRNELPTQYKFQRKFPLYKVVSPRMAKRGALIMQPIVEPDRNKEKELFVSMMQAKDPVFLRRTIEMIVTWDRAIIPKDIIHIHGDRDKTVPIKNVKYDYLIPKGSHMMTLTRSEEVSALLNKILRTI